MANERKAEIIIPFLVLLTFIVNMTLFKVLTVDVLTSSAYAKDIVYGAGQFIPAIKNFEKYSDFHFSSQCVYLANILMAVIFSFLISSKAKMKPMNWSAKHVKERAIGTPILCLVAIVGFMFFFPGNPESAGFSAKINRSIYTSHFGFSFWFSVFFIGISVIVAISASWISAYPKIFGWKK